MTSIVKTSLNMMTFGFYERAFVHKILAVILLAVLISCDKREGVNPCDSSFGENYPIVANVKKVVSEYIQSFYAPNHTLHSTLPVLCDLQGF